MRLKVKDGDLEIEWERGRNLALRRFNEEEDFLHAGNVAHDIVLLQYQIKNPCTSPPSWRYLPKTASVTRRHNHIVMKR